MGTSRKYSFRIYKNGSDKFKIKNLLTGGTLGPEYDTQAEAEAAVTAKVDSIKAAQTAGTKDPTEKS